MTSDGWWLQTTAGAVNLIKSEEEFDLVLKGHARQLVVLEASLTWCRPCKGFDRAYQASSSPCISHSDGVHASEAFVYARFTEDCVPDG